MTPPLTVLIVEDDFHVGRLHAGFVDAVPGFVALPPASSAGSGLRAIRAHTPDLVLVDVFLPDASGLELLRSIDVDAMVLSAANDPASLRQALRGGALAYLIKPFSAADLAGRLRGYARYRRLLEESTVLSQAKVEAAWAALHPSDAAGKATSATEQAVLQAVAGAGAEAGAERSAADVARAVGISRTTAQRYLSALADDGLVRVSLRYGTTGRPEHLYGRAEG